MKTSFTRHFRTTILACSLSVAGLGLQAQDLDIGTPDPNSLIDSGAEQIGLMPYQKTPVEVGTKERNPFANRTPKTQEKPEELENIEEDRIRVILSELPIGGVSRGKHGLHVLLGDMKLERGAVVPRLLQDQTAQLMVSLITEEKIEFAWLEKSGGNARRLVLPIDIEPKVGFVLHGQMGKAGDQRSFGVQEAPSSLRRDSGILDDGIR